MTWTFHVPIEALKPMPRVSWREWFPATVPDPASHEWLTRQEVLGLVLRDGFDVPKRNLMYWESEGYLPIPICRFREGVKAALYHPLMPAVIREFRRLRGLGFSPALASLAIREHLAREYSA